MNPITDLPLDDPCSIIVNPVQQPPPLNDNLGRYSADEAPDTIQNIFDEIIHNVGRYSPVEAPATIQDMQETLVMVTINPSTSAPEHLPQSIAQMEVLKTKRNI